MDSSTDVGPFVVGFVALVVLALALSPWLFMVTIGALYHHGIVSQTISFVESILILVASRLLFAPISAKTKGNG